MIHPVSEQIARNLREGPSYPRERIVLFFDPSVYRFWIEKISNFISSRGGSSAFGVERYGGNVEFFTADGGEEFAMIFLTEFAPQELFFFGPDWKISISSYPEEEYSKILEYSARLFGTASIIEQQSSLKGVTVRRD